MIGRMNGAGRGRTWQSTAGSALLHRGVCPDDEACAPSGFLLPRKVMARVSVNTSGVTARS